jgi:glycerol-3-phosphate acyltransferase PlsY
MGLSLLLLFVVSYLIGSIPAGYLLARAHGIDIRKHGSGNIGATNVLRVLGKKQGYLVFFLDALKGFVAVRLGMFVAERFPFLTPHAELVGILAGAVCVIGHSAPVWLKFKGGKGAATALGVLAGLSPFGAVVLLLVWIAAFEITRYVSLASIISALALPFIMAILLKLGLVQTLPALYFATVIALIVIWRHRTNIVRLRNGTEPRFERKS